MSTALKFQERKEPVLETVMEENSRTGMSRVEMSGKIIAGWKKSCGEMSGGKKRYQGAFAKLFE